MVNDIILIFLGLDIWTFSRHLSEGSWY